MPNCWKDWKRFSRTEVVLIVIVVVLLLVVVLVLVLVILVVVDAFVVGRVVVTLLSLCRS